MIKNNSSHISFKTISIVLCSIFTVGRIQANSNNNSEKSDLIKIKKGDITKNTFGKGIILQAQDSSFYMKFSTRIQNRFDGTISDQTNPNYQDKAYLRRARLKFDGFTYSPRLKYKMEVDVVNGEVLDAVLKWNFYKNLHLWYGQTKLPGNRERVISSQKLQFVDRSLLNSYFNIDRDKGFQLRHDFKVGNMIIRDMASVSIGEGKNFSGSSQGHDYTARLEILPFGSFESNGDYFSSDLKRESTPKLALGVTYDYNRKAVHSRGQLGNSIEYTLNGSTVDATKNLSTIFADMMFKYNGWSCMTEYAYKKIADGESPYIYNATSSTQSFYTGNAINTQLGYLLKNNWEFAGRYTIVTPEKVTQYNDMTEYTFGISKYIVGHSLKVQSDVSLRKENTVDDKVIFRLQAELSF